jgi:hypothetical protein
LQSGAGRRTSKHVGNLLEQAIDTDDAITPAAVIRAPLGIESDEVTNNSFPKNWPDNPEQRARVIGDWRRDEARFLVAYPRPKMPPNANRSPNRATLTALSSQ